MTILYTAIAGAYDRLKRTHPQSLPAEWHAFLDHEDGSSGSGWVRHHIPRDPSVRPVVWAKRFKFITDEIARDWRRDHTVAIWIDGSANVLSADFIEVCLQALQDSDGMAAFRHPIRRCVYDEARRLIEEGKGDPGKIAAQMEHYRRTDVPRRLGLFAGGVLVHDLSSPAHRTFIDAWWDECRRWSMRDQLSLPVVADRLDFRIGELPADRFPHSGTTADRIVNLAHRFPRLVAKLKAVGAPSRAGRESRKAMITFERHSSGSKPY